MVCSTLLVPAMSHKLCRLSTRLYTLLQLNPMCQDPLLLDSEANTLITRENPMLFGRPVKTSRARPLATRAAWLPQVCSSRLFITSSSLLKDF